MPRIRPLLGAVTEMQTVSVQWNCGLAIHLGRVSLLPKPELAPLSSRTPEHPRKPAYSDGNYAEAERLYTQALAQEPGNIAIRPPLVRTLLHEGKGRGRSPERVHRCSG